MTDPLAAYRALIEKRPDWFRSAPDDGIEILLDDAQIASAQKQLARDHPEYGAHATAIGVIFDSPYYTVIRDAVRRPDGSLGAYVRMFNNADRPEGVVIVPTIGADVVLTREFRHPVRGWRWQCPRGFSDTGETGEQAAARELEEELGTKPVSIHALGEAEPDNGSLGARPRFYRAEIDRFAASGLGDEAIAEARRFDPATLRALIAAGDLVDGPCLTALALWWAQGD